jgi:hypothetical protein
MPNCPREVITCKDSCEKNKWNVLPLKERIIWFERFWNLLPAVLPSDIKIHWKQAQELHPPILSTRHTTISWLWKIRCSIDTSFQDPYHSIVKKLLIIPVIVEQNKIYLLVARNIKNIIIIQ